MSLYQDSAGLLTQGEILQFNCAGAGKFLKVANSSPAAPPVHLKTEIFVINSPERPEEVLDLNLFVPDLESLAGGADWACQREVAVCEMGLYGRVSGKCCPLLPLSSASQGVRVKGDSPLPFSCDCPLGMEVLDGPKF